MKSRNPLVVEVLRGKVVESAHEVMVAVADDRGLIAGYFGNIDYLTFPRSTIKMLQALPFVESGAIEKFGLDEKMLALSCGSHRGEKQHLLVATQWMEKIKVGESALACGPAWPAHEGTQHEMIKKSLQPSPILNNCSGKHLGLISNCLAVGENHLGYQKFEHPSQVRLRRYLTEATKYKHEAANWGIDGCGIPTYAIPLQNLAIGMSYMLSDPGTEVRRRAITRVMEAWKRYPQLVSGSEDFASAIVEKTHGRVLVKSGAEGTYTALLPERKQAFALKVHDGDKRAAEIATGFMLRALGAITDKEFLELKAFTMPDVVNSRGEKVGDYRVQKGTV